MADLHIEDFYRDTAIALIRLYGSFPRPATLFVDELCGPDEPDEFGLPSPRAQAAFGTLLWLGQQGYLHYEGTIRQEAIERAALGQRCFLLLATPPGLAQYDQTTRAQLLRQALQSGHAGEIRSQILALMQDMTR